jgi:magnesium and cobalt exporter, CNNM family
MIILHLVAVLFLVSANAFFSAAEFSLVAVRLSRVRLLAERGDPRARMIQELLGDLGRVVSGVQVGITLSSLALGYLGEITLATLLQGWISGIPGHWVLLISHAVAIALAFGFLTFLQVVIGELVPKTISLARAERVALMVAQPFGWFLHTFRWAIDLLDGFAGLLVKALGVVEPPTRTAVRSAEELQVLVSQARERGLLHAAEEKFIQSAIELRQVQVREIMVPRPDIYALPVGADLESVLRMFATTQRSRLPVYEGTLDHILGFVHIKDIAWLLLEWEHRARKSQPPPEFHLRKMVRGVLIVPETKPASELLVELRARRKGLAMVVDEFGSILGLATLKDILEQMIGQIHDEFDVVERPMLMADGSMVFDAALNVRDLEAEYNIALPDDPAYETLGGYVLDRLGVIPRGGETFEADGYRFTVLEMDRRRISRVRVLPLADHSIAAPPASTSGAAPSEASSKRREK